MIYADFKRGCDARVEDLKAEFGTIVAERIIEAEALDFLWDGRVREHYLGQQVAPIDGDEADRELARVAVLSSVGGRWFAGLCLVDGEGEPIALVWKREHGSRNDAEIAFERAR